MNLLFIDRYVGDASAFAKEVAAVSARLGINPNWLMAVMWKESKLNPAAKNKLFPMQGGYPTGLIQFLPSTALDLGTTVQDLAKMNGVDQLRYVEKYLKPFAGKMKSYFDTYAAVFFPLAIGKPDNWVFETKKLNRSKIAAQNPGIDLNKDGKITIGEFKEYLVGGFTASVRNVLGYVKNNSAVLLLLIAAGVALKFMSK